MAGRHALMRQPTSQNTITRGYTLPELNAEQKDHALLLANNMSAKWLAELLTEELHDSMMSSTAGQLLLALNIKLKQS